MIKIGCWKFILCKYTEKILTLGYKLMKNFFNLPVVESHRELWANQWHCGMV